MVGKLKRISKHEYVDEYEPGKSIKWLKTARSLYFQLHDIKINYVCALHYPGDDITYVDDEQELRLSQLNDYSEHCGYELTAIGRTEARRSLQIIAETGETYGWEETVQVSIRPTEEHRRERGLLLFLTNQAKDSK